MPSELCSLGLCWLEGREAGPLMADSMKPTEHVSGPEAPAVIPITQPGALLPISTPFLVVWQPFHPTHRGSQ
jgi:hypothetical protein